MKKFTLEQLIDIYKKLPQDLLDALFNVDTSDIVESIGKKYKLTIDKTGELGSETSYVMLGVTHPNEFIPNLADRLEIDKETARAIANDINEQIFRPVRDSLRKIHNIRDEESKKELYQGEALMGEALMGTTEKESILAEIEKDHAPEENKDELPAIMRGVTNPFDAKTKGNVHIAPTEEVKVEPAMSEKSKNKYPEFDPYRESIE